jgi:DNA-binding NarL/FixJ family response regulator
MDFIQKIMKGGMNKMEIGKLELLAIEDNPGHIEDLKSVVGAREDIIVPDYVNNLKDAISLLGERNYDGILSDAMFPAYEGGPETTSGIQVIDYACEHEIPFAVVTSLYHHDEDVSPVHRRMQNCDVIMLDSMRMEDGHKAWDKGIDQIVYYIEALKSGELCFKDGNLVFGD